MGIINDAMSSRSGSLIVSAILGLGLSMIFRKVCKGRSCIEIRGPKPEELEKKIFGFGKKCYEYKAENVACENK